MTQSLLDTPEATLVSILGRTAVARVSPAPNVWRTIAPRATRIRCWKEYNKRKRNLLRTLIAQLATSYLHCGEDPVVDNLKGDWMPAGESQWIIPHDLDIEEVYAWLHAGNWIIYSAYSPCDFEQLRELASEDMTAIGLVIREKRLLVAVYSFHDNDPWTIAVGDPSWLMREKAKSTLDT